MKRLWDADFNRVYLFLPIQLILESLFRDALKVANSLTCVAVNPL